MPRNKKIVLTVLAAILFAGYFVFVPQISHAATNISSASGKHWGWNDIIGWIDFNGTSNVNVNKVQLTGYASSSVGYIALDCATSPIGPDCAANGGSDYKVKNDGSGLLSGWAWNDQIGWISFCGASSGTNPDCPNVGVNYGVRIDQTGPSTGTFSGWAWNDLVGWISFNCDASSPGGGPGVCGTSQYDVETSWIATSTTAYLESTTYDTGVQGGAIINSVMALGIQATGTAIGTTAVGFQFAVSNSSSGPWSYATSTNYPVSVYSNISAGTPTVLGYELNNNRYFRYRVTLTSDLAQRATPLISGIIVNWSP